MSYMTLAVGGMIMGVWGLLADRKSAVDVGLGLQIMALSVMFSGVGLV